MVHILDAPSLTFCWWYPISYSGLSLADPQGSWDTVCTQGLWLQDLRPEGLQVRKQAREKGNHLLHPRRAQEDQISKWS